MEVAMAVEAMAEAEKVAAMAAGVMVAAGMVEVMAAADWAEAEMVCEHSKERGGGTHQKIHTRTVRGDTGEQQACGEL